MSICFLINDTRPPANAENRLYLANAALALGHAVHFALIDSLACHNGELRAQAAQVSMPLTMESSFANLQFTDTPLANFDAMWVLGVGLRQTFLDKMQLLTLLSQQVRVINAPDALFFLHSKISQFVIPHSLRDLPVVKKRPRNTCGVTIKYPETHVSSDFKTLWQIAQQGGDWIVKPAGESLGRDVFLLKADDSNARAILQTMTGHDGKRYCLLQRYVDEAREGEKRVLIAGGKIIGQYRKKATLDHRGNLHQEGIAALCDLSPDERAACERIGNYLLRHGVVFAGLDMAWPYLLEWNVLNPGGIGTIDRLGGGNLAKTVIQSVLAPSQSA